MAPTPPPSLGQAYAAVRPIVQAASEHLNARASIRCAEYVVTWVWLAEHLGEDPTIAQHSEALGLPRRTYLRRRADFRLAFPDAQTPRDVPGAGAIATTQVSAPVAALRFAT